MRRVRLEQRELLLRRQGHRRVLRRPVLRRRPSARRAGSSSTSPGTRTPTGSPTPPARRTPRPRPASSRPRTRCGWACRTSTRPGWPRPRATPPASDRPRPTRPCPASSPSRTTSTRACPRSTCATCARPAGPASPSRWARFTFDASYSHETRDGNKNTTFYGGPDYEVATPIDFTTDNFRFGGEFAKGRFFANVTADFSSFTNDVQYATIDNPERLQLNNPNYPTARTVYNDATTFRLWMPPDNDAYQVDATAGMALPARHKLTALALQRRDEDGPRAHQHLDQLRPRPAAAEPAVHRRAALLQRRGEVRHVHGPGAVHRRPHPLARLQPVLPQVRARGQDRGLQLHEHGPRRRRAPRTAPPASPASTRAGASSLSAARCT